MAYARQSKAKTKLDFKSSFCRFPRCISGVPSARNYARLSRFKITVKSRVRLILVVMPLVNYILIQSLIQRALHSFEVPRPTLGRRLCRSSCIQFAVNWASQSWPCLQIKSSAHYLSLKLSPGANSRGGCKKKSVKLILQRRDRC
jgi:hypothetical protein